MVGGIKDVGIGEGEIVDLDRKGGYHYKGGKIVDLNFESIG